MFFIVLIVGFVGVFSSILPKKAKPVIKPKRKGIEWEDVGEEIKSAIYNLASTIKKRFEPKKAKKEKKK